MSLDDKKEQTKNDGYGPLYHRIYSVPVLGSLGSALQVMQQVQTRLNEFSPQALARFEKVKGSANQLLVGDEFQIHITGPWNGPVRVSEVSERQFRLVTLQGHLEAGQIRFSILQAKTDDGIYFEIESLARSRDAIVDFVYDKLQIAKLAQTEMWTYFCQEFADRVGKLSNSPLAEPAQVNVLTERQDEESGQWQKV